MSCSLALMRSRPAAAVAGDVDPALEVRVHQRHFDQGLRLRIVIDQQDADVAEVMRAYRSSHAGGVLGFSSLCRTRRSMGF